MNAHPNSVVTPRIARGGKAIYGAPLGILMLEAKFPRIPGDMGNGTTWPFPVLYRVVNGASPEKVVLKGAAGLLPDFIDADHSKMTTKLARVPKPSEVPYPTHMEPNLVIEFYSR